MSQPDQRCPDCNALDPWHYPGCRSMGLGRKAHGEPRDSGRCGSTPLTAHPSPDQQLADQSLAKRLLDLTDTYSAVTLATMYVDAMQRVAELEAALYMATNRATTPGRFITVSFTKTEWRELKAALGGGGEADQVAPVPGKPGATPAEHDHGP